jgi:hypothetical protein
MRSVGEGQRKGNMLDTNAERAGIEERFETACNASSLKVEAEKGGAADLMIAAGWSDSRVGMALLRLHSEWDGAAKPKKPTEQQVRALAESFKAQDETERANRERENGELARLEGLQSKVPPEERFDLAVAIMERKKLYATGKLPLRAPTPQGKPETRARTEATAWYRRELRLLAQSLKSRASVNEQLTHWAILRGIDPLIVGPALHHWLAPKCTVCEGHGRRKIPDAPALSAKQCHACQGTGNAHAPEGSGRVLTHIDYVVQVARQSLKKRLRPGG